MGSTGRAPQTAPARTGKDSPADVKLVFDGIPFVVRSPITLKLLAMVERVARYPTAVLIHGETGSGKELVARAVHHYSLRCSKPWVDVNCSALPEHLIESELFGYEKGAFSGAESLKLGFFELANHGTLFLDEIGELEPKMQVKLLRVLDGAGFYRLGGNRKVSVDVRIVAATNRNLEEAVADGRFRSDLYHRLSQVQLRVPPLRERPEDVQAIANTVLEELKPGARFSPDAAVALRNYAWPGNIRELRNVVTQLAIMREDPELTIERDSLPPEISGAAVAKPAANSDVPVGDLDNMERVMIERALARANNDQAVAAEQLGISRRTLTRKLKLYKIDETGPSFSRLGALSSEQHRYFRASGELRVELVSASDTLTTTTTNVSATGMGVQSVTNPFKFTGMIDFKLHLGGTAPPIAGKGRMTWADASGRAGVRFVSLEGDSQQVLEQWLATRVQEEGWARLRV